MRTNIILLASRLSDTVAGFRERVRRFYYAVMLAGHPCPRCGGGPQMVAEGTCRCRLCEHQFDPTLAFQMCPACGGRPTLQVRRYRCRQCGADVRSRFLFDGLVFDTEYFRQRMVEHRRRRREQKERVRMMLAECRSMPTEVPGAIDLDSVPGLTEALDDLTAGTGGALLPEARKAFDLQQYQDNVLAQAGDVPLALDDFPPLVENRRRDRIWRFVTVIFMAHAGLIDIWQEGNNIMVIKREAH